MKKLFYNLDMKTNGEPNFNKSEIRQTEEKKNRQMMFSKNRFLFETCDNDRHNQKKSSNHQYNFQQMERPWRERRKQNNEVFSPEIN